MGAGPGQLLVWKVGSQVEISDDHARSVVELEGYANFEYSWPGKSWPECECPTNVTCRMPGARGTATYSTRYAYEVENTAQAEY